MTSVDVLLSLGIGLLFAIGLFQMLQRQLIRSAMGLVIISNAINLFLITAGRAKGWVEPYTNAVGQRSDALPQALVLTAIVISLGGFAFVLGLIVVLAKRYESVDSRDLKRLKH